MDIRFVSRPGPIYRGPFIQRPYIPLGLETLYSVCRRIYPDQPNPLQVAALVKFWQGGPDPLDYISMYSNPGNPSAGIEPHWHYVSFGLSDLHGDERVHKMSGVDTPSGFGFELTFRLKKDPGDRVPPTWPAAFLQALAKYVFHSKNMLCASDHVPWHCPLDNSESRIQHMLMFEDPQLGTVQTPYGLVSFIQIVGVCMEELQAAQRWNGLGIIEIMKTVNGIGGPWLVTDMRRGESMFEMDPTVQEAVNKGVEADGSNLSGVNAKCSWQENKLAQDESEQAALEREFSQISVQESEEIKATLQKGLLNSKPVLPQIRSGQLYADANSGASRKEFYDSNMNSEFAAPDPAELLQTKFLDSVHLHFNLEAGTILPLALKGRLKHGRHFTFKSVGDDKVAITLVPLNVSGAFVDIEHPYTAYGEWLQVLLTDEDIQCMLEDLNEADELDALVLPKTFEWCNKKLLVTLMYEDY